MSLVKRNIDRLGRLVNNVLNLQKLSSGIGEIVYSRSNLKIIIEEICAMMKPEAIRKNLNPVCELPETDVYIECDSDRIRQVLINLISNAIKFTHEGGQVVVRLSEVPEGARIEVVDTGIGIPKEEESRIFDLFQRSAHEGHCPGNGFGVGLSVCKKIIDIHHGNIKVESQVGVGSRFIVFLPASVSEIPK